jgi:O-antigen/teichoic acid export membrane protein
MSLKKKILYNSIASAFQKGIRVLNQLILVPFFISAWGAVYYGEWLTLSIFPSVLALSDFGLGTAASNSFILKYSSGEIKLATRIIKSGFKIVTLSILFGIALSVCVILIVYKLKVLNYSLIDSLDAIKAILILTLSSFICFYIQLFEGYYIAARKAFLSINLRTFFAISNIFAGLFVLLNHKGIVEFAVSQLLVAVIFNLYYAFRAISLLKLDKYTLAEKFHSNEIANKGFGYLLSPIWQSIYFQGSTIMVRIVLGPESVVIFNTVRTAIRSINQIFNIFESATLPEMQYKIGKGDINKSKKLFRLGIWFSFIIASAGSIFLFFFGIKLYNFWTKDSMDVPVSVWNIFLLGLLFNSLWWSTGSTFKAFNQPYKFTLPCLISSIISIFFTYYLSIKYQLNGAAAGNLMMDIIMAIYILPVSLKLYNMTFLELIKDGYIDIKNIIYFLYKNYIPYNFK